MKIPYFLARLALGIVFAIVSTTSVAFALPPITATDLICVRCVQFGDLAYNAVRSVSILNNTILNEDISSTAAISPSKILGIAWTANNDGPGSGLNADFLDGLDSLQFLRSDVSGTLNGNLVINGFISAFGGGLSDSASETTFALENTGTGGQPWLIRSTNDTSGHGGGKLVFDIGGVAKAVVTPDAKFGIGTASPANNLDVVSGGNTKIFVHANDGINDRNPELELMAGNTDAGAHSVLKFSKTAGTVFEKLRIQNGSGADVLTLDGNGNVGVGTANPGHRLEVNGPGGSTMALSTIDGYGPSLNFGGGTSFKILASNVSDSVGSNKLVISNVGSGESLLTVDYTGNVGVDTTNPGAKLEVADGGVLVNEGPAGNPFVKLIGDFATEGLNMWYENNTGHSYIDNIYPSGNLYLRTNNGATDGITISPSGTVATGGNLNVNGTVTSTWLNATGGGSETNVEVNNTGAGGVDWLIRSTNNASGHGGGKLVFDIGGVLKAAVTAAGNLEVNGDVIGTRLCIGSDCRTVWPSGSSSGGNVSGSGTADRLAKWTGGTTLGNSPVYIVGGNVGIGTASPSSVLDVQGDFSIKDEIAYPDPSLSNHSDGSVVGTIQYYINQGYGNIHLQPGNYSINGQLTLNSNLTIEGAGWDSKIIMSSSSTSDGIAKDGSGIGIDNVILKDFFIDSNSSSRTHCIFIGGSEADRNNSIRIEGLKVQDCGEHGIHVKGTNQLILANIDVSNSGTDTFEDHNIYLRRINNAVIANVVSRDAAANGFNGYDLDGVTITNFIARSNGFRGIRVAGSSRVTISNSQAIDNGEIGFMIQEELDDISNTTQYSYNVTLSGCVSYGNGGSGVRLGMGGDYYVVTGCVIRNNGAYGVQLYSSPSHVIIDATVFNGNSSGAYTGTNSSTVIGDISSS